jgi:hypothetical protein
VALYCIKGAAISASMGMVSAATLRMLFNLTEVIFIEQK